MLSISTVGYVYDLAEQLSSAGVAITAIPHTPVGNLVVTANPSFSGWEKEVKGNAKDVVVGLISGVTKNTEDASPHTAAVSALSQHLADNVTRHISVARSTVKGAVVNYTDEVMKRAESYRAEDPVAGFTIEKTYIPEPLLTESLLDDLKIYKNSEVVYSGDYIPLGARSDEELVKMLYTGAGSVDREIDTWVTTLQPGILSRVWSEHFTQSNGSDRALHAGNSYGYNLNAMLALYLFARNLTTSPAAVEGMSPLVYNTKLKGIEQYAAGFIHSYLRELNQAQTANRLLLSSNTRAKSVSVYGPVYDLFMDQGGSTEVILGMVVSGSVATSLDGVRAVQEKAVAEWNRYVSLANYNNKKNRAELLRSMYLSEYVASLSDMDEFEKGYHAKNPGYADYSLKCVREYLNGLNEEQLECLADNALVIIAKYRFGYTQAYQILKDIEEAMTANPNLDPREAATIATINLVSDYVSAQLHRV